MDNILLGALHYMGNERNHRHNQCCHDRDCNTCEVGQKGGILSHEDNGDTTSESLQKFMDQLSRRSDREVAAFNVVRVLGAFLHDGGDIPRDLALSIGGCLEDYVDVDGNTSDPDLQILFKEVLKRGGW